MPRLPILSDVDVYGAEPLNEPSDDELCNTDYAAYFRRQDRRLFREQQRIFHRHGIPTDLLATLRLLADPEIRDQVFELCASVDLTALDRDLAAAAQANFEETRQCCQRDLCKNRYVPQRLVAGPWPHVRWCRVCLDDWYTRESTPPSYGILSALNAVRRELATLTIAQWARTLEHFQDRCAYCGGPWCFVEHVTPVSRGGGTDRYNCVPTCERCNARKSSRTLAELGPRDFYPERLDQIRAWLTP